MEIHGPHVEQNHASLKAIVEDDVTRSLEQNIIEVMRRTGLLLQKRQAFKYKWEVEGANELKKMDLFRRVHLSRPRTVLSQLAYNFWVKEYNQHSSYNVQEVIQEGIPGAIVIHTSNSNSGYFIPDHMTGGNGKNVPASRSGRCSVDAAISLPSVFPAEKTRSVSKIFILGIYSAWNCPRLRLRMQQISLHLSLNTSMTVPPTTLLPIYHLPSQLNWCRTLLTVPFVPLQPPRTHLPLRQSQER